MALPVVSTLSVAYRIIARCVSVQRASRVNRVKSATNWSVIVTTTARRTNGAARMESVPILVCNTVSAGSTRSAELSTERLSARVHLDTTAIPRSTARKVILLNICLRLLNIGRNNLSTTVEFKYYRRCFLIDASGGDQCLRRPCGVNAKCRETLNGFECTCDPGCNGDPHQACICDGGELCKDTRCGLNAACRIYKNQPQCYCPPNFPFGDPMHGCK